MGLLVSGCGSQRGQDQVSASPELPTIPLMPSVTSAPTAEVITPLPEPVASPTATTELEAPAAGVLQARPAATARDSEMAPGVQPLGLLPERDALVYIPAGYTSSRPATLVLLLHGAGGVADHGLSLLQGLADTNNLLLLAPSSRRQTWDMIHATYGPDVAHIDQALTEVFGRYAVEPARLAVGGFSDGASYALSLGLINGDLFTHVIAFSPGYMAPTRQAGQPRIFISHGTRDEVLPIDRCSRKIVPRLQSTGYDVDYREFEGPHTVPPEIAQGAIDWLMSPLS